MDVQPEQALEIVYRHLKQNYSDCDELQSALEMVLISTASIGKLNRNTSHDNLLSSYTISENVVGIDEEASKVLFEQESPNIYREAMIDSQWCALLLENVDSRDASRQALLKSLSDYKIIVEAFKRDQV
jgi:hypothetical protein